MYAMKKSLSSAVVITTFLLTTDAFAMKPDLGEDSNTTQHVSIQVNVQSENENFLENEKHRTDVATIKREEDDPLYSNNLLSYLTNSNIFTLIKGIIFKILWPDYPNQWDLLTNNLPEIKQIIFIHAAPGIDPGNLRLVCKDWKRVIDEGTIGNNNDMDKSLWNALNVISYEPLLNLELLFKPNFQSDEGTITLGCPKECNPLKYTFDLSGCELPYGGGVADKYNAVMTDMETFFNDRSATNYLDNTISPDKGKLLTCFVTHASVTRHKEESWAKLLAPHMSTGNSGAVSGAILFRPAGWKHLVDFTLIPLAQSTSLSSQFELRRPLTQDPNTNARHIPETFSLHAKHPMLHIEFVNQNKNY